MLANTPEDILLFFIGLFLGIAALFLIGGIILAIRKTEKSSGHSVKKHMLFMIASIMIAAASWFINLGVLRIFLTFLLIPILHGSVYLVCNMWFLQHLEFSVKMKKYNLLFVITYLLTYLLFPDGGGAGDMYFFFGLIHNQILSGIAYALSRAFGVAHVIFFVLQIVEIIKIKKRKATISDEQRMEDEAGI